MGNTGFWLSGACAALAVIAVVSVVKFGGAADTAEHDAFNADTAVTFCDITARRRLKSSDSFRGGAWRTAFDQNTGIASITRHFVTQNGDGRARDQTYRCIVNTFTNLVRNFQIAEGHL